MMTLRLPVEIQYCLDRLEQEGYQAYVVGGCVRDSLLGRTPEDWDLCTSALPEQVSACFAANRVIPTGERHGTVTVLVEERRVEVTTFRRDGEYTDHRHPASVAFTGSLAEDLARRDFTVNAMAYHPTEGLIDLFGGREDLAAKTVRCVGQPDLRFTEDALRILRLFRFCAALGFAPHPDTLRAASSCGEYLEQIAAERISAELAKLLVASSPGVVLGQMADAGVLQRILPEFAACVGFAQNTPYHNRTVDRHIFAAVDLSPPRLVVRLALLLHDIEKPRCYRVDEEGVGHFKGHEHLSALAAEAILRRLRWDKRTARRVVRLIDLHNERIPARPAALRKLLSRLGVSLLEDLLAVRLADTRAKNPLAAASRLAELEQAAALLPQVLAAAPPLTLGDLAVSGRELMALGFQPGQALGEVLAALLDWVLEDPARNEQALLLRQARAWLAAQPPTSRGAGPPPAADP